MNRRLDATLSRSLFYIVPGAVVLFSVFPFYRMFIIGTNTTAAINQFPPVILPGGNFFINMAYALESAPFVTSILNSITVSIAITVSVLVLASLAGFAFATLGIITFMHAWNDFFWPLVVLKSREKLTVQIALRTLNDSYYQDHAMILAATFVATLPLLVAFLLFSKRFIAGIAEGALK